MDWDDRAPLWHQEANDLYFGATCEDEESWPLDEEDPDGYGTTSVTMPFGWPVDQPYQ